jgi:nucleoside-diphosphate kinase
VSCERTLALLKPDATRRDLTGTVNAIIEANGLRIVAQKRVRLTPEQVAVFYAEHSGSPRLFAKLCAFIASGPVVAQVLEGEDAVARYRTLMGAGRNPCTADPGTLRRTFALGIRENTVHGSSSLAEAAREIPFFFAQIELDPALH